MLDWVESSGVRIVVVAGVVWIANRFGLFFIRRAVNKALERDDWATEDDEIRREETLVSLIYKTFKVFTWGIAVLIVLSEFGFNIGPFLAGAGVIGLALAFGAQELIKDFVTGVFIVMENQYRVGDVVELNGQSGRVQMITLRTTVLRDLDGQVHHIRNGQINEAINKTMGHSRINLDVGVSYESNIDKVEKVINDVGHELAEDKKWQDRIIEPPLFVRVDDFDDSSMKIKVFGKTTAGQHWAVAGEFRKRLKKAFDKNGIEIPLPQRVIHEGKHKKE